MWMVYILQIQENINEAKKLKEIEYEEMLELASLRCTSDAFKKCRVGTKI